ncbi:MAG: HypC/HybG/HupF family hydrogenase formation chaperone [Spirochaetaceae bacterium]|nr:HypC/HybG/HupF family hydrogenase formation chaperone [Spirochaetaceae bacterium]
MCLATPVRIVELGENPMVAVEKDGVNFTVSANLFPDVQIGDYVLVHAGFIIQKIDTREAQERIEMINELYRSEL